MILKFPRQKSPFADSRITIFQPFRTIQKPPNASNSKKLIEFFREILSYRPQIWNSLENPKPFFVSKILDLHEILNTSRNPRGLFDLQNPSLFLETHKLSANSWILMFPKLTNNYKFWKILKIQKKSTGFQDSQP